MTFETCAPELVLEPGLHNELLDVWAVGCVAYQLATGNHPFKHCNYFAQLQNLFENLQQSEVPSIRNSDELLVQCEVGFLEPGAQINPILHQSLQLQPMRRATASALMSNIQAQANRERFEETTAIENRSELQSPLLGSNDRELSTRLAPPRTIALPSPNKAAPLHVLVEVVTSIAVAMLLPHNPATTLPGNFTMTEESDLEYQYFTFDRKPRPSVSPRSRVRKAFQSLKSAGRRKLGRRLAGKWDELNKEAKVGQLRSINSAPSVCSVCGSNMGKEKDRSIKSAPSII